MKDKQPRRKLKRTVQCMDCSWRKDSNVGNIENYSRAQHVALKKTIRSGLYNDNFPPVMACHEDAEGEEGYCVGYLSNQLGEDNNLALRMQMFFYEEFELELQGEQFETFEATIPRDDP